MYWRLTVIKRKFSRNNERWSTCVHEAAHAVVSLELGNPVYWVRINSSTNGTTMVRIPACSVVDSFISLSGSVAENLWGKRKARDISHDDWKDMRKRKLSEIGIALVYPRVVAFVKNRKKMVEIIAVSLYYYNRLSGKQVKQLLGDK